MHSPSIEEVKERLSDENLEKILNKGEKRKSIEPAKNEPSKKARTGDAPSTTNQGNSTEQVEHKNKSLCKE